MSYAVVRRTGEIGLRMALGALPAHVLRMILRESLTLVLLGVASGGRPPMARAGSSRRCSSDCRRRIRSTYGTVALVLAAVALLASLLPARRASRIDPIVALRVE